MGMRIVWLYLSFMGLLSAVLFLWLLLAFHGDDRQ